MDGRDGRPYLAQREKKYGQSFGRGHQARADGVLPQLLQLLFGPFGFSEPMLEEATLPRDTLLAREIALRVRDPGWEVQIGRDDRQPVNVVVHDDGGV